MDEKYLEALEFDKIRARAADGIVCPEARGMLLGQPAWETPDEVRAALEQTDAMTTLLIKNGSPRFSSVENVRGIVQRAEKGGVLSMAELLTVADTLRNFRELVKWYGLTEHDVLPVDDLFYAMTPQPTLEKTIKDSILSENEMADTASDTLYDIRRKIHAAENSIRDKLDAIKITVGVKIFAGRRGFAAQRALCRARESGAPRRGGRRHPRRFFQRFHVVCGAYGRGGGQCQDPAAAQFGTG